MNVVSVSLPFAGRGTDRRQSLGPRTVDVELGVSDNLLDLTVGLKVVERLPCERAVNLQAIDEGGNGDEAVGLDILLELVVDRLVENDGVLGLVLDCMAVSGGSPSKAP
jgi:hypothetical protein